MTERSYYAAYDDRYRQVYAQNLQWFSETPSPIVAEILKEFSFSPRHELLEIGCGEGRDACFLLGQGFNLLATDISPEAIAYCRSKAPDCAEKFQVLDCVAGGLNRTFDFIYAISVVHMLVLDADRDAFYTFIRTHLRPDGLALIGAMGDGRIERRSDVETAFELQTRVHEQTGKALQIAATSCRMVSFQTFDAELERNGLAVIRQGLTAIEPDFPQMMFAAVRAR